MVWCCGTVCCKLFTSLCASLSFMCVMCGMDCESLCSTCNLQFALVVFAFLFCDLVHAFCTRLILRWSSELNTCVTVAIVLWCLSKMVARIDCVPWLRCYSSCFATLVQPGCFQRLLFCLHRAYFTLHGVLAVSALFACKACMYVLLPHRAAEASHRGEIHGDK